MRKEQVDDNSMQQVSTVVNRAAIDPAYFQSLQAPAAVATAVFGVPDVSWVIKVAENLVCIYNGGDLVQCAEKTW